MSQGSQRLLALLITLTGTLVGCSARTAPAPKKPATVLPTKGANTQTSLKIGDSFPAISSTDLEGNAVTLGPDVYGNRATLIVFWSTWCGPCMSELPHEIKLAEQYADLGLKVIGINADESPSVAIKAVQKLGIPWLNLHEGPNKTISTQIGVTSWPTLFLLDAHGTIISASPILRGTGAETLPNGTTLPVKILDRSLEELLLQRMD